MSHERIGPGRSRTLHPEQRREPEPPQTSQLTPELVNYLQRGAGNAAVGRLLRLRTAAQFKSDSKLKSGLITLDRSDPLKEIDATLEAYDLVRGGDLEACRTVLLELENKITAWMRSKGTIGEWRKADRADEIEALDAERKIEIIAVEKAIREGEEAEATARRDARMDALLTPAMNAITDPAAKARAVFAAYMKEFRGKTTYTTTSKTATIWDGSAGVACAMIARGLKDLLLRVGCTATVVQIAPVNFVTKQLGSDFIDTSAVGNLRRPGKTVADERRFFFSEHHIVEVDDGLVYFDPTSGIEVTADAPEIVEFEGLTHKGGEYADSTWRVKPQAEKDSRGGGIYELTPAG